MGGRGCDEDQLSGQIGLKKGRAMAVAMERAMEAMKSSHMAASAVAADDALALASMKQAAMNCAVSDSDVAAFMPREELGLRANACSASRMQQQSTTAAGAVGEEPEAARVTPPAMPMEIRRQQRMTNEDMAAETDVCM